MMERLRRWLCDLIGCPRCAELEAQVITYRALNSEYKRRIGN